METLLNYDKITGLKNLIILVIENVVCYFVILEIMSKIYLEGAVGAFINGSKRKLPLENIEFTDLKKKSVAFSYIWKELLTMVRTPIFFIECIIIPIFYPLSTFAVVIGLVKFAELVGLNLWKILNDISLTSNGLALFLSVGQIFYMMNFSSIVAVSREANNAMLVKYLPISLKKQFDLKISLGLIVNTLATFLVTIFYYRCTYNAGLAIVLFLELSLINLIGEKLKLIIDLNKPKLKWEGEYTMMKQNTNIMYELFYTFVVAIAFFLISLVIKSAAWYLIVMAAVLYIVNLKIDNYIKKNEYSLFGKLYK